MIEFHKRMLEYATAFVQMQKSIPTNWKIFLFFVSTTSMTNLFIQRNNTTERAVTRQFAIHGIEWETWRDIVLGKRDGFQYFMSTWQSALTRNHVSFILHSYWPRWSVSLFRNSTKWYRPKSSFVKSKWIQLKYRITYRNVHQQDSLWSTR